MALLRGLEVKSLRTVGDFAVDDYPTRGYTTRAKEEQRRTAAPVFTGRVRRWEKRWVDHGHLPAFCWVHAEVTEAGDSVRDASAQPAPSAEGDPQTGPASVVGLTGAADTTSVQPASGSKRPRSNSAAASDDAI